MSEILTGNTSEKWEQIKTHPFYKKDVEDLVALGERLLEKPCETLLRSDYLRFVRDGNRSVYESIYFERRRRISCFSILTRLFGEKYLDPLCDALWLVMDESTWVVPAHMGDMFSSPEKREGFLDLFATETGALLAETYHILSDVLPTDVSERILTLVRKRVVEPYLENYYWWMDGHNNWSAVCTSQAALCILYVGTHEQFRRAEPHINRTMNIFLSSYGEDGCCLEGLSYWAYGFGTFLNYADAVKNYTKSHRGVSPYEARLSPEKAEGAHNASVGVIDYFAREDVKRCCAFASNMRLSGDYAVAFSDGTVNYRYPRALFYIINKEYPGLIEYPDKSLSSSSISAGSHNFIRYLLWSDPDADYGTELKRGTVFYKSGQWFIRNEEKYSLAAKGGNNDEPHNHNDVGSFMITAPSGILLCDTGSGEYTRQYFEPGHRYSFLVNSSRGHSLPIINGYLQSENTPDARLLENTETTFAVGIERSYKDPTLLSAVRRFECLESEIRISDTLEFSDSPKSLTERFVSFEKPELFDGCVRICENAEMRFDPKKFDAFLSSEEYIDHAHRTQTLYFIDLCAKDLEKNEQLSVSILIK